MNRRQNYNNEKRSTYKCFGIKQEYSNARCSVGKFHLSICCRAARRLRQNAEPPPGHAPRRPRRRRAQRSRARRRCAVRLPPSGPSWPASAAFTMWFANRPCDSEWARQALNGPRGPGSRRHAAAGGARLRAAGHAAHPGPGREAAAPYPRAHVYCSSDCPYTANRNRYRNVF